MPLDYLSVKQQINKQASAAPAEVQRRSQLLAEASQKLRNSAADLSQIQSKVAEAAQYFDRLSCAIPTNEPLTASHPLPPMPETGTLIAIDGSQIQPSPHEAVGFYLLNLGWISKEIGSPAAPQTHSSSRIVLAGYQNAALPNESGVSLERDSWERVQLAELAADASPQPVITLTDGVLELWSGSSRSAEEFLAFETRLEEYLAALAQLEKMGAATAGYIDKPRAGYVVRMLEVANAPPEAMPTIRDYRPYLGLTDIALFRDLIKPGERSSVFAFQFHLKERYAGPLALHFFYINVGTQKSPWLARVEIPAWVAHNPALLDAIHAVLLYECQLLGQISYPYVLHRAHELAVVRVEDREQVQKLVSQALRAQGLEPGPLSYKQSLKNLPGRTRR